MLIKREGNNMRWSCGQIIVNSCMMTKKQRQHTQREATQTLPCNYSGGGSSNSEHFDIVGSLG